MRINTHTMAYADRPFGYHQLHSEANINFDEDDSAVVDPAVLGTDIMRSPEDAHPRRSSFANGSGALSPADSQGFEHQYGRGLAVDPSSAGGAHSFPDDHHGFGQHATHMQAYGQHMHPPGWLFEQGSGYCTPTAGPRYIPPPPPPPPPSAFNVRGQPHHRVDSARGSFSNPPGPRFNPPHLDTGFMSAPQVQAPMSPIPQHDHMMVAQHEVETRRALKRIRGHSPPRTSVDIQRRDGIRKKNGRIEIPEERSIEKIEQLIETETDEDQLKELKQQKRLLRNREAALASRQRKKRHTEDLEYREKDFTQQINTLTHQNRELERECHENLRNLQVLVDHKNALEQEINAMREEKRDMVMKHTEETATLRKRIQVLQDLNENVAPAMAAEQSSAGLTDFNVDIEGLNLGPHDWEGFMLADDLQMDASEDAPFESNRNAPVRPSSTHERRDWSSTVISSRAKKSSENPAEQPTTSGLLFLLLLCGAFVTSKSGSSHRPQLPHFPPEVRAEASTVLHNLLSESEAPSTYTASRILRSTGYEPAPSSFAHANARPRSRLDHIHGMLTTPSKQQEAQAALSLTAAEYASMSNMDFGIQDERPSPPSQQAHPPTRHSIAEALDSSLAEYRKNSKADVYTRSLEQTGISSHIVEQMKEFVLLHHEQEAQQQQQLAHDDMFPHKIET